MTFRQLVNTLCNLAHSVKNVSVFLHVLPLRFQVRISVFSDTVAIGYKLRLSTRGFLTMVHAVVSSRSQTKVSSFIFILGLFNLSVITLSIYFSLLVFYIVVSLFLALRSCRSLYLGQLPSYFIYSSNHRVTKLYHYNFKLSAQQSYVDCIYACWIKLGLWHYMCIRIQLQLYLCYISRVFHKGNLSKLHHQPT